MTFAIRRQKSWNTNIVCSARLVKWKRVNDGDRPCSIGYSAFVAEWAANLSDMNAGRGIVFARRAIGPNDSTDIRQPCINFWSNITGAAIIGQGDENGYAFIQIGH